MPMVGAFGRTSCPHFGCSFATAVVAAIAP
jgi:hypothetical protein